MNTTENQSKCPECGGFEGYYEYTRWGKIEMRWCETCLGTGYLCACGAPMAYALGVWRCSAGCDLGDETKDKPCSS